MTRIERIKLLKELQAGNINLKDLLPKGFTMKIGYGESVQFFVNDVAVNESSFFDAVKYDLNVLTENIKGPERPVIEYGPEE